MISQATITEFQDAVREEYGREMSFDDASRVLTDMVGYYDTLAKIQYRDVVGGDRVTI